MKKKGRVLCLIIAMMMMAMFAMGSGSSSSSGNSNMCENCGRHEKYMGKLCESCYEDFLEWQQK